MLQGLVERERYKSTVKIVMQEKLIAVGYTLRIY